MNDAPVQSPLLEQLNFRVQTAIGQIERATMQLNDHADRLYGPSTLTNSKGETAADRPVAALSVTLNTLDYLERVVDNLTDAADRNVGVA